MQSKIFIDIVSRCGGFFTNKILAANERIVFSEYLRKNDVADVISASNKKNVGILYKLKDEIIEKHYPFNSRERKRFLTYSGYREFNRRIKEHCIAEGLSTDTFLHRKKKFYKNIFDEVYKNNSFARYTRYDISDYQIFKSLSKILFYFHTGISLYSQKMEKEFCSHLPDHRKVTKGISYGKNYKTGKDVVFFPDYMRSDKSIISMLRFYRNSQYEIYIFSFKPEDDFYKRLRKKMITEGPYEVNYTIINNNILNEIFGEY